MKANDFKFLTAWGLAFASLILPACSPSTFFGNKEDQELKEKESYRHVNEQCAGIKVSKDGLTTETFLSLVDCFNNDGGLKEVAELAHKLSPTELSPVVKLINENLLFNPKIMHEMDVTHNDLEKNGVLDAQLKIVGEVLENDELIIATLGLLKELYYQNAGFFQAPAVDQELLRAFAYLGSKIEAKKLLHSVETIAALVDSKAFEGLVAHFKGPSPSGRTWEQMIGAFQKYLKAPLGTRHQAWGYELINKIAEGELLPLLDPLMGITPEEIKRGVPRAASVLEVTLRDDGKIFNGMNELIRAMDAPLRCFGGTKGLPSSVKFMFEELAGKPSSEAANVLKRESPLFLTASSATCDLSPMIAKQYHHIVALADTTAIQPGVDLVRQFERANDSRFLINFLADEALPFFAPILAEVRDRGAMTEALLVASLMRVEDRQELYEDLRAFITPVPELGGKSPYQIIVRAMERAKPTSLLRMVLALPKTVESPNTILAPLFKLTRQAILTNEAHPFLDIGKKVLSDTGLSQSLLNSLFSVYNREDFRDAIKLLAKLAKNGRLKDTLRLSLDLFKPFVQEDNSVIAKKPIPEFVPKRRHNFALADLVPFPVAAEPTNANADCMALDLGLSLDSVEDPRFPEQILHLAKCLNSTQLHAPALQAMQFFLNQTTEDGRNYWAYSIDIMKAMRFSPSQMGFLVDSWISAYDDGRFERLIKAVPMLVSQFFHGAGDPSGKDGPVLQPLMELARPLMGAGTRPALQRLLRFGAKHLEREETMTIARAVDRLWDVGPEPTKPADYTPYDRDLIRKWIREKECVTQSEQVESRLHRILYDYDKAVDNWSFSKGSPRYSWNKSEFKENIDLPILARMADAEASDPQKPLLTALLNPLRRFTLNPGELPNAGKHYPRSYLIQWFQEKTLDYQPILYFYPGEEEKVPRVRLVNSLDRLELVLTNADYKAPVVGKNFALQFLGELADSWGDEPEALWPPEIKAKAKKTGKIPPRLEDTVKHILETETSFENLIGFPNVPKCAGGGGGGGIPIPIGGTDEVKKGLFNTHQIIDIMTEQLPRVCTDAEVKRGQCVLNAYGRYERAGLKVLRDIFFELVYSTPAKYRIDDEFAGDAYACNSLFWGNGDKGACAGDKNNLSVALKMTRLGLFRNIGAQLKHFPSMNRELLALSNAMVDSTISPGTPDILKILLVEDSKRQLIWKALDLIFDVVDQSSKKDIAYLKQSGFYLLALIDEFKLSSPGIAQVRDILAEYRPFLTDKIEKLRSFLTNRRMALLARAIFEDQDPEVKQALYLLLHDALADPKRGLDAMRLVKAISDDSAASSALDIVDGRWDVLKETPDYKALHLEEIGTDVKGFLLEQYPSEVGLSTARQIRLGMVRTITSGDLEQILLLMAHDPKGAYQILEAISHEIQAGQLQEYFKLLRRGFGTQ